MLFINFQKRKERHDDLLLKKAAHEFIRGDKIIRIN